MYWIFSLMICAFSKRESGTIPYTSLFNARVTQPPLEVIYPRVVQLSDKREFETPSKAPIISLYKTF